jgi:5-methylcytosine-specific restriction protein A
MPISPNKPCRAYRCRAYQTANGYCADHQHLAERIDRRLPASQRGYDRTWSKFRAMYLRQHPICQRCGTPAKVVHHINPLDKGGAKYDETNLMALCWDCHEREHGRKS